MESKSTDFIGIRVPSRLRDLMREYVRLDTHLNESEFVRTAIREKLQRDAPSLRNRLFEAAEVKEREGERDSVPGLPALPDQPQHTTATEDQVNGKF